MTWLNEAVEAVAKLFAQIWLKAIDEVAGERHGQRIHGLQGRRRFITSFRIQGTDTQTSHMLLLRRTPELLGRCPTRLQLRAISGGAPRT